MLNALTQEMEQNSLFGQFVDSVTDIGENVIDGYFNTTDVETGQQYLALPPINYGPGYTEPAQPIAVGQPAPATPSNDMQKYLMIGLGLVAVIVLAKVM